MNCDVFLCFLDFEKAFDKVKHEKLMEVLLSLGMRREDIRVISNLYWQQTAEIRVGTKRSEEISIQKGVRQGCVLSPLLFNAYSEQLFTEALSGCEDGVVINGHIINNLRYADDTIVLADTADGLQRLIIRIQDRCEEYGMSLNVSKTRVMIVSRNPELNANFNINGKPIQRTNQFAYLGCNLNEEWDHSKEILIRIEKARSSFFRLKKVLCSMHLNIKVRVRVLRCYVFSVLLYGVEAWTLSETTTKRLQAFEMWCYRRMLRASWIHHITNDTILQRMNKALEIVHTVKRRKLSYFGHVMRNDKYRLLQLILQGKIRGKRPPGRRRISWLHNLRKWTGKSSVELFRSAVNRVIWARMIADV